MKNEELIGLEEASQMLGVGPQTCRRWCKRGKIGYLKLGNRTIKLRRQDIETFLTDNYRAPKI